MISTIDEENVSNIQAIAILRKRLNLILLGKQDRIELVLACLLAGGHLLLDDLPGLGKTTLAKAIANCFGAKFARIQCTPDLLPSDITGFNLFNQKTREFEFHSGPIFSDILLADEINRTTPRTQSALFEAMAERQVTIDGESRQLSKTFFVIATQNPIDSHGAYPLPEAQLDRFAMKLEIGYPDRLSPSQSVAKGLHRHVSSRLVGGICLSGLVAFSIVSCYAYYPAPNEVLEEMRLARTEVLSGASSADYKHTLHWIPILDEWSRKLEVGYAIRNFQLRPYQQMQAFLLRKKLELLEHAVEHAMEATNKNTELGKIQLEEELLEIKAMREEISKNARRLADAFTFVGKKRRAI